jgi:hypothetical protein
MPVCMKMAILRIFQNSKSPEDELEPGNDLQELFQ